MFHFIVFYNSKKKEKSNEEKRSEVNGVLCGGVGFCAVLIFLFPNVCQQKYKYTTRYLTPAHFK